MSFFLDREKIKRALEKFKGAYLEKFKRLSTKIKNKALDLENKMGADTDLKKSPDFYES